MVLYIVQHGDAVPKDTDPDRPLSNKGRNDIQRLTEWLSRHDVRVAQIFHSGKTRAQETAEILRPLLDSDGDIEERTGLAPNDSPEELIQQLQDTDKDTLIASHLPLVSRTVSQALTGSPDLQLVDFSPGSIAGIQREDGDSWRLFLFVRPDSL